MINTDFKKRNSSGSRSKSRKSKPNDFSVELKPHKVSQTVASHEHTSKQKTQNSLNKSKGSRKHSKQNKKVKTKGSKTKMWEESKEISRSISAQRKHSLMKINRTQANFQQDDIEQRIYALKKNLSRIQKPLSVNIRQITRFYQQIYETIEMMGQPIYSLLCYMHDMYVFPVNHLFQMISPYEQALQKKQMLNRSIEKQIKRNQQIYNKLQEEDLVIIRLKQKIQNQRQLIIQKQREKEERKRNGESQIHGNIKKDQSDQEQSNQELELIREQVYANIDSFNENQKLKRQNNQDNDTNKPRIVNEGGPEMGNKCVTKGFKIDISNIDRSNTIGFHEQFYNKIDEFSQSWRNQALLEKKF